MADVTREEAIDTLNRLKTTHMGDFGWDTTALNVLEMAIKALEQESILDKIIAEIETDLSHFCFDDWGNENTTWKEVKAIIDKYKAESEDK